MCQNEERLIKYTSKRIGLANSALYGAVKGNKTRIIEYCIKLCSTLNYALYAAAELGDQKLIDSYKDRCNDDNYFIAGAIKGGHINIIKEMLPSIKRYHIKKILIKSLKYNRSDIIDIIFYQFNIDIIDSNVIMSAFKYNCMNFIEFLLNKNFNIDKVHFINYRKIGLIDKTTSTINDVLHYIDIMKNYSLIDEYSDILNFLAQKLVKLTSNS